MRFDVWGFHSAPEVPLRSHLYELSVSTDIYTKKATPCGLRMHIMLHGVNGSSQSPPRKRSMSAGCSYQHHSKSGVTNESWVFFFFLLSDFCSGELKASSVMQRFGPESGADKGRAAHRRMDEWKQPKLKVAIRFLLIDLSVQQRNPLIFTWLDPFIGLAG